MVPARQEFDSGGKLSTPNIEVTWRANSKAVRGIVKIVVLAALAISAWAGLTISQRPAESDRPPEQKEQGDP